MQVAWSPVRLDLFMTNRCVEGESHIPCLLRMSDVNGVSVSGNAHLMLLITITPYLSMLKLL